MSNPTLKSNLSVISTTVLWKIENFSRIAQKSWAESSHFFLSNQVLYLQLKKSTSCIYLYIFQDGMSDVISSLSVEVCFIDPQGKNRFLCNREVSMENGENLTHLMNIMESCMAGILKDDTLTVRCTVSVARDQMELPAVERISLEELDCTTTEATCLETLSTDLENFYKAKKYCDTVLIANGVDYPTHRAVLSARSSAFAGMFQPSSSECQREVIEIPNMQASVLGDIISYVYTGKVRGLTSDTVTQMFDAADKYSFLELKEMCLKFIHDNLTVENIRDIALLAEKRSNQELRKKVERFIADNVVDVLKSTQWKEFTKQYYVLANDMLSNVLLLCAENAN